MIRTVRLSSPKSTKSDAWKRAQRAWYLRNILRERAKALARYHKARQ